MGRMIFTIVSVIAVGIMLVMAKQDAKHTDHTADAVYPCSPICAPVTKEMERAFGKTDGEIIRDIIIYERTLNIDP